MFKIQQKKGGSEFITSTGPFEKIGPALINIRNEGKYVLTAIDYFSRYLFAAVI